LKQQMMDLDTAASVLGIAAGASDDEVRAAYLRKVREHPPERAPQEFERVRDAYAILSEPERRIAARLFGGQSDASFASLLDNEKDVRELVGPEPWLDVLKRR
jgi:curved DNA-binding protein CbpA